MGGSMKGLRDIERSSSGSGGETLLTGDMLGLPGEDARRNGLFVPKLRICESAVGRCDGEGCRSAVLEENCQIIVKGESTSAVHASFGRLWNGGRCQVSDGERGDRGSDDGVQKGRVVL